MLLLELFHNNSDAYFKWNDGQLYLASFESANANTTVVVVAPGTGKAAITVSGGGEWLQFTMQSGVGELEIQGSTPVEFKLQKNAEAFVSLFSDAASGETQELKIFGYRAADAARSLEIGVGVDAADTASFDGLSNYLFDGIVIAPTVNLTENTALLQADGTTILANDGTSNLFIGEDAFNNDSGGFNVGVGYRAGYNNDTTGG